MTADIKASAVVRGRADIPKSYKYALDDKRVFIVTPVYRDKGESTKEILTKLMREETKKN